MFGVKWTNRVLIGAVMVLFGATLPAIAEVRSDDVSPTTVRVAVAGGGANPWPFLDSSSVLPRGWDLVNPFAAGIDKTNPAYWQFPIMAGSEIWREYDAVVIDLAMMQNPVMANSMMRGVDAGLILWVRSPFFKVTPSGEGAIVYAPTIDNPHVLAGLAMRVLRLAGTHKMKSRHSNGTWQTVTAPLLEQWGSTDVTGVRASSAADTGYIRPAIYDGVMYVVGFYKGQISLLALDMDPIRDLNGDGNPDDGILDYGVHGKEDLVWAYPLNTTSPTSEPTVYPAGDETRVALTLNDGTTMVFRGIMPGPGAAMQAIVLGTAKPASATNFPSDVPIPAPVFMGKFVVGASAVEGSGVGKISLYTPSQLTPYPDATNPYEVVLTGPISGSMSGGWVDIEGSTMPLGSDLMLYVPQKATNGAALISSVWFGAMNERPTSDDQDQLYYEPRIHHAGMKVLQDSIKVYLNGAPVSFTSDDSGRIKLAAAIDDHDTLTMDYIIDVKRSGLTVKRTDVEIADVASSPTQRVVGGPVLDVHDTLVFTAAEPGTAGSGVSTLGGGTIYGYEEQLGAGRSRLKWRWDAVTSTYSETVNGTASASLDYRPTVTDWMIPGRPTGKATNFRITSPVAIYGDTAYVCGSANASFMGATMPGTLLMAFDATPSVDIDLGETVEAGTTVSVKQLDIARSTLGSTITKRLDVRINARTNTLNLSNLMTPASSGAMQNAISLSQPIVLKLGDNKLDSAPFMPPTFNNMLWMVFIPGTSVTRQPAVSGGVVYLSAEVNGASTLLGLDAEPLRYYPDRMGKDVPLIDETTRGTLLMPAIGPLNLYNNATEAINTFMQRVKMVSPGKYSSSFTLADTSVGMVGENGIKLLKTVRTFVAAGARLSQYGPEGDVYWDCDGPLANPWLPDLNLTFARASKAIPFNVPNEMLVVDTGNNRVLVMNERGRMGSLWSVEANHQMPIMPISSFSDPNELESGGSLSLRQPVDADWYVKYINNGGVLEPQTHLLIADQGNGRLVDLSLVRPNGQFPFTTQLEWSSSSLRNNADGLNLLERDGRLKYTRLDLMRNPDNSLAGIAAVLKGMDSAAPGTDLETAGSERVYIMLRFGNNKPVAFDHFVLTLPDGSDVNVPFSDISSLQLIPRSVTGNVISHYGLLVGMNSKLSQDPNQNFKIGILVPDDPNNPTKLKSMMMFSQGDYMRLRGNTGAPAQFPVILKPNSVRMLSNGNLLVANGSVAYDNSPGSKGYTGLVFEIDPDSTSGGVPGPSIPWWLPTIRDIPEYADRW